MTPYYADDQVTLYHGDALEVLRSLDAESVDAVVTDPPYGLEFMGREWDGADGFRRSLNAADAGRDSVFGRASRTSPEYRAGALYQQWCEAWATECLRVLKPGGHLLAFGGTRTVHRLTVGIEDAGFEIRDGIDWLYGSGFPKSLNVGDGRGTALKPAREPIVVARKPLAGTVAQNVEAFGTGALNIDATRVAHASDADRHASEAKNRHADFDSGPRDNHVYGHDYRHRGERGNYDGSAGRWPSNVVLSHAATPDCEDLCGDSCEDGCPVVELDRQSGVLTSGALDRSRITATAEGWRLHHERTGTYEPDSGGASRFFPVFRYEAKAPTAERPRADGVAHPTVKPLELMRWLVRLVTPPGGLVLDLFAGSGTTGEACVAEGFRCLLVEREAAYLPLIVGRLSKPIPVALFADPTDAYREAKQQLTERTAE